MRVINPVEHTVVEGRKFPKSKIILNKVIKIDVLYYWLIYTIMKYSEG